MIDEIKLDDFFDVLARERDPRLVKLLQVAAQPNHEVLRAVLEVLSDQYPTEVEEILAEYKEDEDDEEEHVHDHDPDSFGDENLYGTDLIFGDYEMAHENDLDVHFELLLQNPEAINSLLVLIAQNMDLEAPLLELLEDPDLEFDWEDLESTPVPTPGKKKR